jgi:hypothetical protein
LVLALPLVGIKSDFSNAVNSGTSNKAITDSNITYSSSYGNFYSASGSFNGSSSYLNTSGLSINASTFTVEFWINFNAFNSVPVMTSTSSRGGIAFYFSNSSTLNFLGGTAGGSWNVNTNITVALTTGTWYHFACVRSAGGTFDIYKDGILLSSVTSGSITHGELSLGRQGGDNNLYFNGYIQDFRAYSGLAKYTSNFIPASTDPDIVPDSPSGVSYSSNVALVPSTDGAVAFDGSGDYLSLASSADFAFGTGDFTVEFFFYSNNVSSTSQLGLFQTSDTAGGLKTSYTSGIFIGQGLTTSGTGLSGGIVANLLNTYVGSNVSEITKNVWYHCALTRSSGTVRLFINGNLSASATISGSIDGTNLAVGGIYNSSYLFDGFISNFHVVKGTALYTSNFTPPSAPISSVANTKLLCCKSNSSATAFDVSPGSISFPGSSISAFRDSTSSNQSWDSSSVSSSTSQALGPDDIYWSDLGATCTVTTVTFAVNVSSSSNISLTNFILYYSTSSNSTGSSACSGGCTTTVTPTYTGSAPGNVYVTFSGLNLSARYLGITNGSGSYSGTLTYSNVVITVDNVEATNFNPFTVNINTQRGKQSGYATLDPLRYTGTMTFSNGNLNVSGTAVNASSNIAVRSGKWYAEFVYSAIGSAAGVVAVSNKIAADALAGASQTWQLGYTSTGFIQNAGSNTSTSTFAVGDTIGLAFDCSTGMATFYKNGVSVGSVTNSSFANVDVVIGGGYGGANGSDAYAANFGQKPFKFPPPAGFQPLTLANTPRPTIVRPDQFVGIVTYLGTSSARSLTVGFKPDFIWFKDRTGAGNHNLHDSVRGSTKFLYSNLTNTEATDANGLISFDPYGFSFGNNPSNNSDGNITGRNTVAWCWKAGGNSNTFNINDVGYATASAAGLTAGTITPTGASVNTKSGFSIIKVPGTASAASFSHGLGQAPAFVIFKETNGTGDWQVGHKSLSSGAWTSRLGLNLTTAEETTSSAWNNTPPTSSLITVGATSNVNNDFIVYAWAEVPGFSKFGSYTGTSSTNFINLGFKPVWVMIKNSSSSSYPTYTGWAIFDAKRTPNNTNTNSIFANSSQQEGLRGNGGSVTAADFSLDLLSNGFCLRDNGASEINLSGNTYIYAAWAETPTFNLYGAMSNAR